MSLDDLILSAIRGEYDADELLNDPLIGADDPMIGAAANLFGGADTAMSRNLRNKLIANTVVKQRPAMTASVASDAVKNALAPAINDAVARNRQRVASLAHTGNQPSMFLGIDSAVATPAGILAGAAGAINVVSSQPCRPVMLTTDPTLAASFVINSIMVGNINLLLNAMPIPALRFAPDAARPPLRSPMLPAGTPLVVNVTNISGAAARFIGSLDVVDLSPSCGF